MSRVLKRLSLAVSPLLLTGLLVTQLTGAAIATHEPADKAAAAGSDIDQVDDATPVLSETMRVSSKSDLILQLTAECSILTELTTGNEDTATGTSGNAFAYGSVRLWIEIDGKRVPVSTDDTLVDNDDENGDTDEDGNEIPDESDIGEVTFCNRAYERTVTDDENDDDGQDTEHDYIRTRTANAFNWLALDAGTIYDLNNDNLLDIKVWADFDETTVGNAVADAFVGSRTLIIEPTHASVHEEVGAQGGAGS